MSISIDGTVAKGGDPFAIYQAMLANLYDTDPLERADSFAAHFNTSLIGSAFMHWGDYGAARHERTRKLVSRGHEEDIALMLVAGGEYRIAAGENRMRLRRGDMVLLDRRDPVLLQTTANRMINISFPRSDLARAGIDFTDLHATRIDGAFAPHLRGLVTSIAGNAPRPARLQAVLTEILHLALDSHAAHPSDRVPELKKRAIKFIAANLGDEALEPMSVARALGISRATLYRLFAADGGISRRIRTMRLEEAHRMLVSSKVPRASTVAYEVGFTSPSHFSRVFREHFGLPPSSVAFCNDAINPNGSAITPARRMRMWRDIAISDTASPTRFRLT